MSSVLSQSALLRQVSPSSAVLHKERVPLRRLDEVAGPYLRPDDRVFLKIDAQGYDAEVLAGARGLIDRLTRLGFSSADRR